jgi:hypothetical protein
MKDRDQKDLRRIGARHEKTSAVPQRFAADDDQAAGIQLRLPQLSRKNYSGTRWNRYAYQQAAIL